MPVSVVGKLDFLYHSSVLNRLAQAQKAAASCVKKPGAHNPETGGRSSTPSCSVPMHVGGLGCQKNLFSILTQLISALPCSA